MYANGSIQVNPSNQNVGLGLNLTSNTTSILQLNGDISLLPASSSTLHMNSYYAAGWKYGTSGYYSGAIRFDASSSGSLQFLTSMSTGAAGNPSDITERVRIDRFGNVSVGTSTVGWASANRTSLTLNGTTDTILAFLSNGSNRGYLWHSGSSMELLSDSLGGGLGFKVVSANPILFSTNNIERARIDGSGNFGIGTGSSTSALLAIGNGAADSNNYGKAVQITNLNGNRQQIAFIRNGNNALSMGYYGASATWGMGTGYTVDANFSPNFISIDQSTGYVGIGTPTPGYKLDVNGAINCTSITAGSTSYTGSITLNRNYLYLAGAGDTNHAITNQAIGDGEQFRFFNYLDLYQTNGGGQRVYITNAGMGIGMTTPQTLLTVGNVAAGTAEATYKGQIQIQSAGGLNSQSGLEFKMSSASTGYGYKIAGQDLGSGTAMIFGSRTGSASWSEVARFSQVGGNYFQTSVNTYLATSSGSVGIATTAPVTTLTVKGSGGVVPSLSSDVGTFTVNNNDDLLLQMGQTNSYGAASLFMQGKRKTNDGTAWNLMVNPQGGGLRVGGGTNTTSTVGINLGTVPLVTLQLWDSVKGGDFGLGQQNDVTPYMRLGMDTSYTQYIANNAYWTGAAYNYVNAGGYSGQASRIAQYSGIILFDTASGGVNPITWTNRMYIANDGKVGISTTPSYKLDVNGQVRSTQNFISNSIGPVSTGQFAATVGNTLASFYNDGTNFYILKSAVSPTAWDGHRPLIINLSNGQVTIAGTGQATFTGGSLNATGEITAYSSDLRLKKNIKLIDNALDKVSMLRGVIFDWNDLTSDLGFNPKYKRDVGVIAQEVQAVLPEAIRPAPFDRHPENSDLSKTGENYLTVQYEKLTALLIEAVKDLNKKVETLEYKLSNITGE